MMSSLERRKEGEVANYRLEDGDRKAHASRRKRAKRPE
jgi:hypothetical protein